MKVQLFGAVALNLAAVSATSIERRSNLIIDVCPTYLTRCDCYEASIVRDCGWDSQAVNGGQCKKGSTFDIFELEDASMDNCAWTATTSTGHIHTNTDSCKQWTNACSCNDHADNGCGWKSAVEFQTNSGISTVYDATNGASQTLQTLGECRYGGVTDQYELEDSNSALADLSDNHPFNCEDSGCSAHKTPCDCFRAGGECGWSSADYRNVDDAYILNKDFFQQGRCKSGSTTLGIEVAYYAYITGDSGVQGADECVKDVTTSLVDCEIYETPCDCWEQGVIANGARCGWSSANNNCNYLSRFSQAEVSECASATEWATTHLDEFEALSQSDATTAAHVVQADREWLGAADMCYWKDGVMSGDAAVKATRCQCFDAFIGDRQGPNGESLTSCGWTGTKEAGMCQADAAWDVSSRPARWAQEAFECLDYEEKRGLCDPYNNITKACECDAWAQQMNTLTYFDVEAIVADPENTNPNLGDLTYIWSKVNFHVNGDVYGDETDVDAIKSLTPFLTSSCWYDDAGNRVSESQHDDCMSWQFCGWSSEYVGANACFHGKYTSPEENDADECIAPPPVVVPPEPTPDPIVHIYYSECSQINDPIVCALYSIDANEVESTPYNKGCTWNSGDAQPCQQSVSIMELQEVLFPIQNGLIINAQVKVGGSIYLTQRYSEFNQVTPIQSKLTSELWVPHLPTLAYSHPWRPFVEADTCYVISDIMAPVYIPQSYIANSAFDDDGALYNCIVDNSDPNDIDCTANQPYPNVLNLDNDDTSLQYSSGLEYLAAVDLKYIDPTLNDNEGPGPGFCTADCLAERASVIALTSATRAPFETEPDPLVTYTHAILVDAATETPILYDPCVLAKSGGAPEYVAARDAFANGGYAESGLNGS